MSWRSGSALFAQMWPAIQKHVHNQEHRIEFTSSLLKLMVRDDMDPYDVEDIHAEVRAAMRLAGFRLAEPGRYGDDELLSAAPSRPWWRFWR